MVGAGLDVPSRSRQVSVQAAGEPRRQGKKRSKHGNFEFPADEAKPERYCRARDDSSTSATQPEEGTMRLKKEEEQDEGGAGGVYPRSHGFAPCAHWG